MKKIVGQGFLLILLFLGVWFGLASIHWMDVCEKTTLFKKVPDKLGTLYWDYFKGVNEERLDSAILLPIDSLVAHICLSNDLNAETIKVHVLDNEEINALALPDGHIVIYTGLLTVLDDANELCGILCHEMAHSEENHVMKKLVKEIGLISLLSNVAGNNNGQFFYESLRVLTSTAYDRGLEEKADQMAVEYMIQAGLNPLGLAKALDAISQAEVGGFTTFSWLRTHPDTQQRIQTIEGLSGADSINTKQVVLLTTWEKLKEAL